VDAAQCGPEACDNRLGRFGEKAGWVLFALFPVLLAGVLVWALHAHG
jgi:hypothetical protein